MSDDLYRAIIELREENADLRARIEPMFRPGKVTDVDAAKGRYRQEIGVDAETGEPLKSAWIYPMQTAGARRSHSLPSVGQQMMQVAPDGDHAQAFGVPLGWSDANPSPSTRGDEDVDQRGDAKRTMRGDKDMTEVKDAGHYILGKGVVVTKVKKVELIKFKVGDRWFSLDPAALLPADDEDLT